MKKRYVLLPVLILVLAMLTGCCLSHEWQDATCEAAKTCAKCGKTEGEALGHTWQDATCETAKSCSTCGKTEGEPLGHAMVWSIIVDNYEKMNGICSVCGVSEEADMDWEAVAYDMVLGHWNGDRVYNESGDNGELGEGVYMDVLTDGTATLVVDGEIFEMTWSYKETFAPFESLPTYMIAFDFVMQDGGVNYGTFLCMQGYSVDTLRLHIGETTMAFMR